MDLADAMGVSYQAVSNWERGNSMPDISKIPEICQVLGLSFEELVGEKSRTTRTVKRMIDGEDGRKIGLSEPGTEPAGPTRKGLWKQHRLYGRSPVSRGPFPIH